MGPCPFLRSASGSAHRCLARVDDAITISERYVAVRCSTRDHVNCSLYIHADDDALSRILLAEPEAAKMQDQTREPAVGGVERSAAMAVQGIVETASGDGSAVLTHEVEVIPLGDVQHASGETLVPEPRHAPGPASGLLRVLRPPLPGAEEQASVVSLPQGAGIQAAADVVAVEVVAVPVAPEYSEATVELVPLEPLVQEEGGVGAPGMAQGQTPSEIKAQVLENSNSEVEAAEVIDLGLESEPTIAQPDPEKALPKPNVEMPVGGPAIDDSRSTEAGEVLASQSAPELLKTVDIPWRTAVSEKSPHVSRVEVPGKDRWQEATRRRSIWRRALAVLAGLLIVGAATAVAWASYHHASRAHRPPLASPAPVRVIRPKVATTQPGRVWSFPPVATSVDQAVLEVVNPNKTIARVRVRGGIHGPAIRDVQIPKSGELEMDLPPNATRLQLVVSANVPILTQRLVIYHGTVKASTGQPGAPPR